jgi:competence protein ComEA
VVLNLATAEELRRLPGIGPSKATAIVELRTRLKKFRRVTDLLRVRGIGPKSLKRLEAQVVLDAPTAAPGVSGASPTPKP